MKDELIQQRLAQVMLLGVIIAATIMFAGWAWFAAKHPGNPPADHLFTGEPQYLKSPVPMFQRAFDNSVPGQRTSVIMIGILLLLINPLIRVALATVGFMAQRDRLYFGIGLIVFGVLLFSLWV